MTEFRVQVRLPDEWREPLERLAAERGIAAPGPGRSGGLPQLVRELIGEALGEETVDQHAAQRLLFAFRRGRARSPISFGPLVPVVPERLVRARSVACYSADELACAGLFPTELLEEAEATGRIREQVLPCIAEITGRDVTWFRLPWPVSFAPELEGLAKWVRTVRSAYEVSQREVARQSGTHVTNVGRWEKGLMKPTPASLRRLRKAYPDILWPPDSHKP